MAVQFYLVQVSKLMTCDEADIVPSWGAYIAEGDIHQLLLKDVAELISMKIKGAPATNLRPMTEDEIKNWREQN